MVTEISIPDFILKLLEEKGVRMPITGRSEEEQSFGFAFSNELNLIDFEKASDSNWFPITIEESSLAANEESFFAFIDGVQRTIVLPYWLQASVGAIVPVYISHIAAGVMFRKQDGSLHMDPQFIFSRLLIVAPFEGLNLHFKPTSSNQILLDTDEETFSLPQVEHQWVVCDTTFRGTDPDRKEKDRNPLKDEQLFDTARLRSRALGRVAVLRQRLEMALLAKVKHLYTDKYVLVDGPLFFLDKWASKVAKAAGINMDRKDLEENLMRLAVGLIKTHRLRPSRPERVLGLAFGQRTPAKLLEQEVDIDGIGEIDETGSYRSPHLTWYTRLRENTIGLDGVVRIDIHKSTLGIDVLDDFVDKGPNSTHYEEINKITAMVLRERWPNFRSKFGSLKRTNQLFPIDQLEKALHSRLYPSRILAHFPQIPLARQLEKPRV